MKKVSCEFGKEVWCSTTPQLGWYHTTLLLKRS